MNKEKTIQSKKDTTENIPKIHPNILQAVPTAKYAFRNQNKSGRKVAWKPSYYNVNSMCITGFSSI